MVSQVVTICYNHTKEKKIMSGLKEAKSKSLKDIALEEVKEERQKEAVKKLKKLYSNLEDAKLIVRNIEREIEDYIEEVES